MGKIKRGFFAFSCSQIFWVSNSPLVKFSAEIACHNYAGLILASRQCLQLREALRGMMFGMVPKEDSVEKFRIPVLVELATQRMELALGMVVKLWSWSSCKNCLVVIMYY